MHAGKLLETVEHRRQSALQSLNPDTQAQLGQYFTPMQAASLIASFPSLPESGTVRILDPGAGSGSLSAALVSRIFMERPSLAVELVAVELDEAVSLRLRETLNDISAIAESLGRSFTAQVRVGDFILTEEPFEDAFDVVIMNPPYAKLPAASPHRTVMKKLGVQTPNIYAAFLAKALLMLNSGGQLVAITPRSFTNGVYFENFRQFFLDKMTLEHIHIFESRSSVFSDTGVLQENIIFNAVRAGEKRNVQLTASRGHQDEVSLKSVPYGEIVLPEDARQFIRIPVGDQDSEVVKRMLALPTTLGELGIQVSTGKVVDFRSRENLLPGVSSDYPMVYPANIKEGSVVHPKADSKPQWFTKVQDTDHKMLVPAGNYVLIKRFSAKEEKRRVVAGSWMSEDENPVAFDNKLNYVHADGAGLKDDIANGLIVWLNSGPVDKYFRTFSGHTQVNATDLRVMRYPTLEQLCLMGRAFEGRLPKQEEIDDLVNEVLEWS